MMLTFHKSSTEYNSEDFIVIMQSCSSTSEPTVRTNNNSRKRTESTSLKSAYNLAYHHVDTWRQLFTGCSTIDEVLHGGFPVRGITQISGESGSGKTQLCLQLCLTVQYPRQMGGLNSGAVYISTEGPFPANRLKELCEKFPVRIRPPQSLNFHDNIFIEQAMDQAQLDVCLHSRLPNLLAKRKIGLIVVDSVAGIFRAAYEPDMMKERAQDMRMVATKLHQMASEHKIVIVCINQVTADIGSATTGYKPALGLAWESDVTSSFGLSRHTKADGTIVRKMKIERSSYLPPKTCNYTIGADGIQ